MAVVPSTDCRPHKVPLARGAQWEQVRRARIAHGAVGVEHAYEGKRRGDLRKLSPALVGYLSSFAALTGHASWEAVQPALGAFVRGYDRQTGIAFSDRVAEKARNYALP